MSKRGQILVGMAAGLVWAVLVVWLPQRAGLPFVPAAIAVPGAMVAPGLVLVLMVGRLAARRFFDDGTIDGQPYDAGSAAEIDQKVLTNTVEQLVLALVLWPFVANSLGGAVVLAMGLGFALARVLFWVGYHIAPPLRSLGFAATFYPTVVAVLWALAAWLG